MHRRRALACAAVALLPGVHGQAALAAELEGVRFEDSARVAGAELRLNGIGLRGAGWLKLYVAGLYLAAPARTAREVLAQPGAKRVRMVMMHWAPTGEFVKALEKGFQRNASSEEWAALTERLRQFSALVQPLREVRKGDVIDLDFEPGRGMVFRFNGSVRGEPVAGVDFYAVLLRSFVGEHPYHKTLRAGMLGVGS